MSLELYSKEQLQEMSFVEIAYQYLNNNNKQPISFNHLISEISATLGFSEDKVRARIAQFYTDLNIDGRFLALGENRWGLRVWYPVDTVEEEVVTSVKSKKKKAKKVVDDDEAELDSFDDTEEDYEFDDYSDEDEEEDDDLLEDFGDIDQDDDIDELDEDLDLEEDALEEDLTVDDDELEEIDNEDDEEEDL